MNLLCGVVGVIFALKGQLEGAFLFMLAGVVFDFCDGFTARHLGVSSEFGKELDSLSDVVTSGVLPAIMMCEVMKESGHGVIAYIPTILSLGSAFRLAKFNLDERQHYSFRGLPAPSAAMLCASLSCCFQARPLTQLAHLCSTIWFFPTLALVLSALMVSEIPMFSLKVPENHSGGSLAGMVLTAFGSIAVIMLIIVLVAKLHWSLSFSLIIGSYILMNLILSLFKVNHIIS